MLKILVVILIVVSGCSTIKPTDPIVVKHRYLVTFYNADTLVSQIVVFGDNEVVYCVGQEDVLLEKLNTMLGEVIIKSVKTLY